MTTKQRCYFGITGMVMIVILLLAACEESNKVTEIPTDLTEVPTQATIQPTKAWSPVNLLPIIEAASHIEPTPTTHPLVESPNKVCVEKSTGEDCVVESTEEEGDFKTITEHHNVIQNRESVLFLGQNDDVLFPGAIIQGKDVDDFVYVPIIAARSPITLSLPFEGVPSTGESIKITVDDPSKLSNVRQGINNLLKSAITTDTKVPAKFDYVSEQVYRSADKNLTLGVSGSYAKASVNYDFDWETEAYENKILSIYKQVYYTVDVDLPAAPYDLFDASAGVEGLAAALPTGSMPMYVSSVSYGWMALLFIETNYSKDQMDMALDVAYDPNGDLEVELDAGYSAKTILQSSKIQIIVYGGSTAGITANTLTGYSGLLELIEGSKDFGSESPAVPISFRLRHLSDNLIAKIALTEEYTITKKVRLREFVKISVDYFFCTAAFDEDLGDLNMDYWDFIVEVKQGDEQIFFDKVLSSYEKKTIGKGEKWSPGSASTVVMLDMENTNPSAFEFVLSASARDHDPFKDDWATNNKSIFGDKIYVNPQDSFIIFGGGWNMSFEVHYSIQPATYEECQTYEECKKQLDSLTP